jgi:flagellar biosynthetic protein FliO
MVWMVLKTFGLLVVIIALIILTLSIVRRFVRPSGRIASGSGSLKVVGTLFLEPKKGIYLVKIVDRMLILGVTEGNISILEKVKDTDEMERLEQVFNGNREPFSLHFPEKLRLAIKKQRAA